MGIGRFKERALPVLVADERIAFRIVAFDSKDDSAEKLEKLKQELLVNVGQG